MNDLAERLTMFIKDLDFYDYMDSMEIDETDDDMIEKNRDMLTKPILVRAAIEVLEKVMTDGTLEEDEIEERERCQGLINELKELYRDQQRQKTRHAERSAR